MYTQRRILLFYWKSLKMGTLFLFKSSKFVYDLFFYFVEFNETWKSFY